MYKCSFGFLYLELDDLCTKTPRMFFQSQSGQDSHRNFIVLIVLGMPFLGVFPTRRSPLFHIPFYLGKGESSPNGHNSGWWNIIIYPDICHGSNCSLHIDIRYFGHRWACLNLEWPKLWWLFQLFIIFPYKLPCWGIIPHLHLPFLAVSIMF